METIKESIGSSISHVATKASSGRLLATVGLVGTVSAMSIMGREVHDALWAMLGVVVTFYFTKENTTKGTQ